MLAKFLGRHTARMTAWISSISSSYVGRDEFANTYWISRRKRSGMHVRSVVRSCNSAGELPPRWSLWMHYVTDLVPQDSPVKTNSSRTQVGQTRFGDAKHSSRTFWTP